MIYQVCNFYHFSYFTKILEWLFFIFFKDDEEDFCDTNDNIDTIKSNINDDSASHGLNDFNHDGVYEHDTNIHSNNQQFIINQLGGESNVNQSNYSIQAHSKPSRQSNFNII